VIKSPAATETELKTARAEGNARHSLRKIKVRNYTYGLAAAIVGCGLYSYTVRELLASLVLFSAFFLAAGLIALGAVLAWYASKRVARWSRSVSRNAIVSISSEGAASMVAGQPSKARPRRIS
jgi:hypothetical protein